ncbi:hypothetical protein ACLB2K_053172 [Fragaria x ananassa]
MVPPNIIADQWTVLVAYWNTEDAKAIATRNSINRETRGPSHNTGRKNFAQLRYEMEQSGEESDKFSVWKKARKESNPEVAQVIHEYNRKLLLVRPVEDQKLTAIKDRVFHDVIGEDGHGYCRTYGSTVPRNLVYPQEPLETAGSSDLIAKITEEVTEKLKESFDKKLEDAIKMLQAQIANNMDCTTARGEETQLHMDWSNFPVGHPSWDCSSINMLNLGVPIPSEAAEPPKGLVLDWRWACTYTAHNPSLFGRCGILQSTPLESPTPSSAHSHHTAEWL